MDKIIEAVREKINLTLVEFINAKKLQVTFSESAFAFSDSYPIVTFAVTITGETMLDSYDKDPERIASLLASQFKTFLEGQYLVKHQGHQSPNKSKTLYLRIWPEVNGDESSDNLKVRSRLVIV